MVEDMAAHISEPAGPEIQPTAPQPRQIAGMIRPDGRGAQPQVPAEGVGYRRSLGRTVEHALRPDRVGRPGLDLGDVAYGPVPDPFAQQADALHGMTLVAHLGRDLGLPGGFCDCPGLEYAVGQGLFAVDVLAQSQGRHSRRGMDVVGGPHDHGVDVLLLFQHDAEIAIAFGVGERLETLGRPDPIHVAESHDVLADHAGEVPPSLPAHADAGDVELVARSHVPLPAENAAGEDHERGDRPRGEIEEFSS